MAKTCGSRLTKLRGDGLPARVRRGSVRLHLHPAPPSRGQSDAPKREPRRPHLHPAVPARRRQLRGLPSRRE
jgi:hypothetical protein